MPLVTLTSFQVCQAMEIILTVCDREETERERRGVGEIELLNCDSHIHVVRFHSNQC